MLNISLQKSDTIGALSSGLCMIHCMATPFFFFAATCSATCCTAAPLWWQWMDYFFLLVSFAAVKFSTNSINNKLINYGLWTSWIGLLFLVLNVKFLWFNIPENTKFIPAFSLIGFHLYNIWYCKCESKECC
ncbi:MAG: hypothetical protein CBD21_04555 [bacterium TMED161]|nr:MAG: hypothetical protein CBD21_04555 [bacterium TMED161]|tara:strand:- start:256 stop:651 length:396 start_codon:yes stop_codon:yes gene_type:complete